VADNITALDAVGSTITLAADDITSVYYARNKIGHGADGAYTDVSLASGLPVQPATSAVWVLGAGSAAVGKLAANDGVDIGDVTINNTTIAVTQSGTWTITGAGGTFPITDSGGSITVDNGGTFPVQDGPTTTGGLSMSSTVSTATNNATSVKASAGQVYNVSAFNNSTNTGYLKLYNKASAPTPASDTPLQTYLIPAGNGTSGAGFVLPVAKGLAFSTGIAFAIVGGIGVTDNTSVAANAFVVNVCYK
jgi:hypothetical protein